MGNTYNYAGFFNDFLKLVDELMRNSMIRDPISNYIWGIFSAAVYYLNLRFFSRSWDFQIFTILGVCS